MPPSRHRSKDTIAELLYANGQPSAYDWLYCRRSRMESQLIASGAITESSRAASSTSSGQRSSLNRRLTARDNGAWQIEQGRRALDQPPGEVSQQDDENDVVSSAVPVSVGREVSARTNRRVRLRPKRRRRRSASSPPKAEPSIAPDSCRPRAAPSGRPGRAKRRRAAALRRRLAIVCVEILRRVARQMGSFRPRNPPSPSAARTPGKVARTDYRGIPASAPRRHLATTINGC